MFLNENIFIVRARFLNLFGFFFREMIYRFMIYRICLVIAYRLCEGTGRFEKVEMPQL